MTAGLFALLCAAGGLGAAARLVVDGLVRARVGGRFPVGTVLINLSGSLLLGLLTGLAARELLPSAAQLVAGTGLLGGYTTFSTASVETVRLVQAHRWAAAAVNGLGVALVAALLAWVGYELGSVL